jgi:hypothetical protein
MSFGFDPTSRLPPKAESRLPPKAESRLQSRAERRNATIQDNASNSSQPAQPVQSSQLFKPSKSRIQPIDPQLPISSKVRGVTPSAQNPAQSFKLLSKDDTDHISIVTAKSFKPVITPQHPPHIVREGRDNAFKPSKITEKEDKKHSSSIIPNSQVKSQSQPQVSFSPHNITISPKPRIDPERSISTLSSKSTTPASAAKIISDNWECTYCGKIDILSLLITDHLIF